MQKADLNRLPFAGRSSPSDNIPEPTTMPVNKEAWLAQLHISNFHNAFFEYRDVRACTPAKNILIVGPGQGLELTVFKSRGYNVTTYDIDGDFKPDHLGSVHDMSCFASKQFDVVIASHVLEHMSFSYFDTALKELARVAHYALIYLPYAGRHIDLGVILYQGSKERHLRVNIAPFWRKPSLTEARYASGQHFWEIGLSGCSKRTIRQAIEKRFEVLDAYQNPYWMVSMNFVLKSNE
ncbi:MAG: class I SAM-dependent methyltransferase [Deltaproteobacteria bacterium]|nr:class I SAM-dependent methyltransferase [Deltaproteobacteria bacterium]